MSNLILIILLILILVNNTCLYENMSSTKIQNPPDDTCDKYTTGDSTECTMSTEYNNKMFLIKLSHKLNIDIDELMLYFIESNYIDDDNITQLEKNRMCKFIAIE